MAPMQGIEKKQIADAISRAPEHEALVYARKQLKEAGLFYASMKVAWYYRSEEFKTKGGKKTLDEIKEKYGSEKVNSKHHSNVIE